MKKSIFATTALCFRHKFVLLLVFAMSPWSGSLRAADMPIEIPGQVTCKMDKWGWIGKINWKDTPVIDSITLLGQRIIDSAGQKTMRYLQDSETVLPREGANITENNGKIEVSGQLLPDDKTDDDAVAFKTVVQVNAAKGRISLQATVTHLKAADWLVPPFCFNITLPVSVCKEMAIKVVGSKGVEREVALNETLPKTLLELTTVSIPTSCGTLVIDAGDNTTIMVLDGRGWGGQNLDIRVSAAMPWKPSLAMEAGAKTEFKVNLDFREKQ